MELPCWREGAVDVVEVAAAVVVEAEVEAGEVSLGHRVEAAAIRVLPVGAATRVHREEVRIIPAHRQVEVHLLVRVMCPVRRLEIIHVLRAAIGLGLQVGELNCLRRALGGAFPTRRLSVRPAEGIGQTLETVRHNCHRVVALDRVQRPIGLGKGFSNRLQGDRVREIVREPEIVLAQDSGRPLAI